MKQQFLQQRVLQLQEKNIKLWELIKQKLTQQNKETIQKKNDKSKKQYEKLTKEYKQLYAISNQSIQTNQKLQIELRNKKDYLFELQEKKGLLYYKLEQKQKILQKLNEQKYKYIQNKQNWQILCQQNKQLQDQVKILSRTCENKAQEKNNLIEKINQLKNSSSVQKSIIRKLLQGEIQIIQSNNSQEQFLLSESLELGQNHIVAKNETIIPKLTQKEIQKVSQQIEQQKSQILAVKKSIQEIIEKDKIKRKQYTLGQIKKMMKKHKLEKNEI